jgi:hypothetical protein
MRWEWHVSRTRASNAYRVLVGRQKERDNYEDVNLGGSIILKWMLEK